MSTLRIRLSTTNAPESMKHGLIKDRVKRARRVVRFYREQQVDIGAVQESGDYFAAATKGEAVKAVWAQFNDYVRGRRIGNGLVVKRRQWKTRKVDDITIGTGGDAIHIAVVDVTHKRTGWRVRCRAIHKPTKRATNADLRPLVDAALKAAHRRDDDAGIPWLDLGDMNGSAVEGVKLASHGPDHIRGSRDFEALGQRVVDRPLLSDHPFLIAGAAVEV